jgi:hypothetical protein
VKRLALGAAALLLLAAGCGSSSSIAVTSRRAPGSSPPPSLRLRAVVLNGESAKEQRLVIGKDATLHLAAGRYELSVVTCEIRCRSICGHRIVIPRHGRRTATVTFFGRRCSIAPKFPD